MVEVSYWHIRGYAGNSDCDGEQDYNLDYHMHTDGSFTKKEIEFMLLNSRYKNMRCVELKVQLISKRTWDFGE